MVEKNITNVKSEICTGCAACMNKCPKDCITMQLDDEGFSVPVIEKEKCINCGSCIDVCPAIHPKKDNLDRPIIFMARVGDELLKESTSGGVFAVLAKYILDKGGFVCGAAFDDSFEVHHQLTDTYDGLKKLKRSKYVQCQPGMIYREVKELLLQDKYVLFSGSPCQVAGLHNYLGKDYERLYTVDILCHGAPAPGNWKKYLSENFDINEIEDIEFRYKNESGARPLKMRFRFKDGTELIQRTPKNPFYYHFSRNIGLRMSCGNCEGAVFPRVGDFSMGDFWGADRYYKELVENAKGLSMIFCNNRHSAELISYFEKEFVLFQEIDPKMAMTKNRRFKNRVMPANRKVFFDALKVKKTFNEAVSLAAKAGKAKYDIAVYGNTLGGNYGGLITYYALYRACEKLGYSTVMIRPIKRDKPISASSEPVAHGTRFCEEYIQLSEAKKLKDFSDYNYIADTFILGSDQIWNQSLFKGRKLSFYLDFVDNSKKKIAYAASFGYDKPQLLKEQHHRRPAIYYWLNQLDAVSVREADGVDVCNKYYDTDACHVLDPVFLLDTGEYEKLASKAQRKPEGRFMTTYQLTPNEGLISVMKYVSEKLNLPRINMGPGSTEKWKRKIDNTDMPWIPDIQVEEWIYNISNAEFIVTDSFHGMCFAIMFRKKFILFLPKRGPLSRVESLLGKLGLMDRWFSSRKSFEEKKDIIFDDIDYDAVYAILKNEADRSIEWLKKAIESKKCVRNPEINEAVFKNSENNNILESDTLEEYIRLISSNDKEYLIAGAFDSTEIITSGGASVQKGAYVYIYNTAEDEVFSSSGTFAHTAARFCDVKISLAASSRLSDADSNYREMILTHGSHKDVYRLDKYSGFVAVFAPRDNKIRSAVLEDFVFVDEIGKIIRDY